ncbi:type III effector protein [Streptomyces sp. NBC_01498]|uniref:type III effector protein n=1 Tax=Streptomyces sp. NBC_01498 TaxID=2975870 RepID=UPI002E7AF7EA|nr:type III effector protein [Streptomyces sp. NBC_01498]WTL28039.1 type III effector protein [Streptomyces sp. NBC_01498]
MTAADQPAPHPGTTAPPATFLAASAALDAIDQAVRKAQTPEPPDETGAPRTSSDQALAALLLLREVRERLAAWEPGLIEAARGAGASWADLAGPLGVASRQAAERRYLRVRPGAPGTTGEQRVQSTRDRRAGERNVSHWARDNSADLRQLAGQITALTGLPTEARARLALLATALADDDPTTLLAPLTAAHPHLRADHPDLADRVDTITRHTDHLRHDNT